MSTAIHVDRFMIAGGVRDGSAHYGHKQIFVFNQTAGNFHGILRLESS